MQNGTRAHIAICRVVTDDSNASVTNQLGYQPRDRVPANKINAGTDLARVRPRGFVLRVHVGAFLDLAKVRFGKSLT